MEKYRRVPSTRPDEESKENEVRITNKVRKNVTVDFVADALALFDEKGLDTISLKAMGSAIPKTVLTAEIIKRKVPGLHQIFKLESNTIVDVYEPLEEGLRQVTNERKVSSISIILSKNPLDQKDIGYQAPLTEEERLKPIIQTKKTKRKRKAVGPNSESDEKPETAVSAEVDDTSSPAKQKKRKGKRGRRRGRKRNGNTNKDETDQTDSSTDSPDQEVKPRGRKKRGRGRGRRGRRGRGGRNASGTEQEENLPPGAPGMTPPPVVGLERPPVE